MKGFITWLIVFVLLFGGLSVITHFFLTNNPTRIAIAFDDSFYMKDAWSKMPRYLKNLADRRYTEYFVVSNKEKISKEWTKEIDLNWFSQTRLFLDEYSLSDLVNAQKYPELGTADKIYVFSPKEAAPGLKNRMGVVYIRL